MVSHRRMIAALILGAGVGIVANLAAGGAPWLDAVIRNFAQPLGQLFIRLLFMLVIPLLFSALVLGVADLELRHLGRLGARMLGYTVVVSGISVLIGVALVNLLGPGRGLPAAVRELSHGTGIKPAALPAGEGLSAVLLALVPDNPVKAAATGDLIGLIVFAILFGIALSAAESDASRRLREMLQGLYDVSMKLVEGVLKLAPYGVAALLFVMTARIGPAVIQPIAAYVGVVIIGMDRLLDMCRTTVNVTGDLAAAVYVARGEPAGTPPRALA